MNDRKLTSKDAHTRASLAPLTRARSVLLEVMMYMNIYLMSIASKIYQIPLWYIEVKLSRLQTRTVLLLVLLQRGSQFEGSYQPKALLAIGEKMRRRIQFNRLANLQPVDQFKRNS